MRQTWALILVVLTFHLFVNASETDFIECEISLQQILENGTTCIKEIKGNKIYLKTDSIFISERGAYLVLNNSGDYASLPELCSDAGGCFLHTGLMSLNDYDVIATPAEYYKKICKGCGRTYWISCQNSECSLKKKNN